MLAHVILYFLAHGHHHVHHLCSEPFLTVNRFGVVSGNAGVVCPAR